MGVFKEITDLCTEINDVVKEAKDTKEKLGVGKMGMGSIAKGAAKSIYYFPLLASKNISPSVIGMISQNLEGAYSSFVRACFSLTPAMNLKDSEIVNIEDYLKIFHQNIGLKNRDELAVMREATEEYKMLVNPILNEVSSSNVVNIIDANRQKNSTLYGDNYEVLSRKNASDFTMREVEVKNAFRPSVIEVTIRFIIGGQAVDVKFPVGVKTMIHPVNSENLIDHIMESVAGKGLLHNFVRYTTGELKSLSDILFGISSIKKRVSKDNDVSKWAEALERRKNNNKIRNCIPFLAKKPYLPNVSILLSMSDIKEIERSIGYNLIEDKNRAIKFMKDNFLLSLVVVDEVTETVYVMHDGDTMFEELPFSAIKRENNKNEAIVDNLIKGLGMGIGRGM